MTQIKVKNLTVYYDNILALDNVSFEIKEGNYLCIVGENGSGKSTLVNSILSLKSYQKGKIIFSNGLNRNEIGYLPQQQTLQKDFPASCFEIVLSGCINRLKGKPFFTNKEKLIAKEKMTLLGIERLKYKSFQELSGGQKQRVLLARALCATSKILFLDEPATGLDPQVTKELYDIIEKLNKSGITIVMVTHDIETSLKYATHILHLKGKCLFFGTKSEYEKTELSKNTLGGCHV